MRTWIVVVGALALASCGPAYTPAGGTGSGGPSAEAPSVEPGAYQCSVEAGDQMSPGECVISSRGGAMTLEQTGTASGIRGTLTTIDGGYHFVGEYFCDGDGCPERFETDFFSHEFSDGAGGWSGVVALERGALLRVTIRQ